MGVYRRIFLLLILLFALVACNQEEPDPAPAEAPPAPTVEVAVPVTAVPTEVSPATVESSPAEEVEPTEAAITSVEEPIYLSIIWHQHQPVYFKDLESNTYIRPWVRVHATKDYVDMAAILDRYPDIHATFNLTPSLIRQLDDLSAGAKDLYWTLAEIPA
ncbi:MAG: hypothetical protein R3293_28410, partial [Candidatus Promineifilaceae bacterium]|nr:hypothetical protein [Candidatus Promineifilaceae bacterium]